MPREGGIQERIIKWLKKTFEPRGAWVENRHGGPFSRRGVPDICMIFEGVVYFFEAKQPGKKPKKAQLNVHRKLRAAGAQVFVVESLGDVKFALHWDGCESVRKAARKDVRLSPDSAEEIRELMVPD
jgi:hypothetical protein